MTKKEYFKYLKLNKLSDSTAETYYRRLKFYIKDKNNLKNKSKNFVNQTKNAVKYYYKSQDIYFNDTIIKLNKVHNKAVNKKIIREKIKLSVINRKINALKNKRLKLAFRLQEVSGLRIFEISSLTKNDIEIVGDKIYITVRNGKGGKSRKVNTIKDKYLLENLQELEERKGLLFYKESTLRKKAWELEFKTHKLRKVTAKYINIKYPARSEKERREILRKYLGHGSYRTLKVYIDDEDKEIDLRNTRFDL